MLTNRKIWYIVGIAVAIVVLIVFPMTQASTQMDDLLEDIELETEGQKWEQARETLETIEAEWIRRKPWIDVNNSVHVVEDFTATIVRLQATLDHEDPLEALMQSRLLRHHWQRFRG